MFRTPATEHCTGINPKAEGLPYWLGSLNDKFNINETTETEQLLKDNLYICECCKFLVGDRQAKAPHKLLS